MLFKVGAFFFLHLGPRKVYSVVHISLLFLQGPCRLVYEYYLYLSFLNAFKEETERNLKESMIRSLSI